VSNQDLINHKYSIILEWLFIPIQSIKSRVRIEIYQVIVITNRNQDPRERPNQQNPSEKYPKPPFDQEKMATLMKPNTRM